MIKAPHHSARHAADGTVRVFLSEALLLPTGLVTMIYLTRVLGPEHYGLFTLAITVFTWVAFSAASFFSQASIKFVSGADAWKPVATTVLRLHLISGAVAGLLLWLGSGPVSDLLDEPRLKFYLQLFAVELVVYGLVQAHRSTLVGLGDFRKRALVSAIRWPVRLVLIVLFVEMGLSVTGAVLGSLGATLVELVLYRLFVRPSLFSRSAFPARQLLSYGPPLFLSALCLRLFDRIDVVALKALDGTAADAGLYAAAQNLAIVPTLVAGALSPLLLSTLGRMIKGGQIENARRLASDGMRLVLGLLPFAFMTAGMSTEIVALVFGEAFATSAPLLALLIFSQVALVMISVAAAIVIALDRPGLTMLVAGPMPLLALAGHALLIPRMGAIGAASVSTGVACVGALAATIVAYRLWRVVPPLATVIRTVVLSGAAYAVASAWPAQAQGVIIKLLVVMAVIVAGSFLLGEFGVRERALMKSLFGTATYSRGKDRRLVDE